jgi:hypothetical protein
MPPYTMARTSGDEELVVGGAVVHVNVMLNVCV